MTPERWLGVVLAAAAVLSIARLVLGHLRAPPAARPAGWRTAALVVLTGVSTFLLYRTLLPPPVPVARDTLVVLTANAAGLPGPPSRAVVALPEAADAPADALRMPDLATALRRHPEVRALVVVGAGLEARDRDAPAGRALAFVAAELPTGIVDLAAPHAVAPGARFDVHARIEGVDAARVALLDPAGRVVDTAEADAQGRVRVSGTARGAGAVTFAVVIQNAEAATAARVEVPVIVDAASPVRVLLFAGAPNPDVRALRRWAEDAGLALRWRTAFGGGAGVGDAPPLDAAALAEQDLVILDARAFDGLGASARAALRTAVNAGLGVLVHAPQPPSNALRTWLRDAGLAIDTGRTRDWRPEAGPDDVARLRAWAGPGSDDAPFDPLLASEPPPELAYLPLSGGVAGPRSGAPDMMRWQAVGRGRLGVVTLADSWHLPLAGRAELHAELWSGWAGTLARATADASARVDGEARVGTRLALCALDGEAHVLAPDGTAIPLRPDPAARACAGVWPTSAGWHRLVDASGTSTFRVRAADEAPGLHAAALRMHTRALVRDVATASASERMRSGASWPWFLGWLLATAALWALGRARMGRAPVSATARIE
ncbi:carboxypeptidase regulatory-like domain-containing protein [Luteimonas sp. WGS1318]|uniref:carboxypeptidase regulatory-like domain-containing protein n=1 Tax=Luteimonas sp. WGS1318 TaxID=3366815 RepID=UPI00372D82BC